MTLLKEGAHQVQIRIQRDQLGTFDPEHISQPLIAGPGCETCGAKPVAVESRQQGAYREEQISGRKAKHWWGRRGVNG